MHQGLSKATRAKNQWFLFHAQMPKLQSTANRSSARLPRRISRVTMTRRAKFEVQGTQAFDLEPEMLGGATAPNVPGGVEWSVGLTLPASITLCPYASLCGSGSFG